jgi:hypothetical protein
VENNNVQFNNETLIFKHEACKTDTQSRTLRSKGIATAIKKPQAFQHSPTDELSGITHLQRIPWAAA